MKPCSAQWLLCLSLLGTPAQAHLLKVFVYAEGDRLQGSSYFSGGAPASGARIQVLNAQQQTLAELQPDAAGKFSYRVQERGDYTVVADTGDGHQARWQIGADELAGSLPPAAAPAPGSTEPTVAEATPPSPSPDALINSTPESRHAELSAQIEQAVARQVGPLREELQHYADRTRLGDLLGGIGFIFGLAGTLLWWRSRR